MASSNAGHPRAFPAVLCGHSVHRCVLGAAGAKTRRLSTSGAVIRAGHDCSQPRTRHWPVADRHDDPAGDSDGRGLRKALAGLDIINRMTPVRRVPAWRCLAEPEQVTEEVLEALRDQPQSEAQHLP